jgi:hypothetical protein
MRLTAITLSTITSLVALAGCGGNEGPPPVVAPAAPPAPAPTPVHADLPPSPHRENANLVPEILEHMRAKQDAGWDREIFLGARVSSRSWEPMRNELTGRLTAKSVAADVVVRARKETNPEACRRFTLYFARDVAGGSLFFDGVGESEPFPCSKAPK